jgi:hypothetical protein
MNHTTCFREGDPVVVSSPVGEEDKRYAGKAGTFVRYAKPHGYAVVNLGELFTVQLHPESLTLGASAPEDRRAEVEATAYASHTPAPTETP